MSTSDTQQSRYYEMKRHLQLTNRLIGYYRITNHEITVFDSKQYLFTFSVQSFYLTRVSVCYKNLEIAQYPLKFAKFLSLKTVINRYYQLIRIHIINIQNFSYLYFYY